MSPFDNSVPWEKCPRCSGVNSVVFDFGKPDDTKKTRGRVLCRKDLTGCGFTGPWRANMTRARDAWNRLAAVTA